MTHPSPFTRDGVPGTTAPRPAPVAPDEVRALREIRGLSVDQFAADLGVGAGEVRGWEAGTLRVPRDEGAWIRYLLAVHARNQAAEAHGIRDCAWMVAQDPAFASARAREDRRALRRLGEAAVRHAAECPDCQRVRAWLDAQPPLPPVPGPRGFTGQVFAFLEWTQRLPRWMRPAVYGATFFGGITFLRLVGVLLMRGGPGDAAIDTLLGLLVGGAMGAAAGLAWTAVHRPLRRLGRAAPHVAGMLALAAACIVVLAFLTVTGDPELSLADPSGWIVMALAALLAGPVLGRFMMREFGDDGRAADDRARAESGTAP